jgi:hypothetical protein
LRCFAPARITYRKCLPRNAGLPRRSLAAALARSTDPPTYSSATRPAQAAGDSNALIGGEGNDSLFLAGGQFNNLVGGTGNDWLVDPTARRIPSSWGLKTSMGLGGRAGRNHAI